MLCVASGWKIAQKSVSEKLTGDLHRFDVLVDGGVGDAADTGGKAGHDFELVGALWKLVEAKSISISHCSMRRCDLASPRRICKYTPK